MTTAAYNVYADLRIRAHGAARTLNSVSAGLSRLKERLGSTSTIAGRLFSSFANMGLITMGLQAAAGAARFAASATLEYVSNVENGVITVAALSAQVENLPWDQATRRAEGFVEQLNELSLASTATGEEFLGIFSRISGPIGGITGDLSDAVQVTGDLAAAASVLGIDFEQASRDTSQMLRGLAGTDTAMFSNLQGMGVITETTEQWNEMAKAQPAEALRRYVEALSGFREAADAQGRSWDGVTSSFKGILQVFAGTMAGPVFESIKRFLSDLNTRMLANKDVITATLSGVGVAIAARLDSVFEAANNALSYVTENWSTISANIASASERFMDMAPSIAKLAISMAAISSVKAVLGPLLGFMSMVASAGGAMAGLFGGGGAAAAAAGAGGEAAAAGGAGGALGGLGVALGPLLIIVAAVAAVVSVVVEKWDMLVEAFAPVIELLSGLWTDVEALGSALWDLVRPIAKLVGGVILIALGIYFTALVVILRAVVKGITWVVEALATMVGYLEPYIDAFVDYIIAAFGRLATWARDLFGGDSSLKTSQGARGGIRTAASAGGGSSGETETPSPVPGERPTQVTHNDMRGSRITVRQEFRQADPDRILVRTMNELNRAAEQRIGSGFAPALTR